MTNEVDVGCLAVVHGMEVVVAVDRVQSCVVGELLFCDSWVVLEAKDSINVVFSLDSGQFTPVIGSVNGRQY